MNYYKLDRRSFLETSAALSALSLWSIGCATLPTATLAPSARSIKNATIRGAFLYPPADVVLAGKCEDSWSKQQWFTWPGNQYEPEAQQAKFMEQVRRICEPLDLDVRVDDTPIYTSAAIEVFIQDVQRSKPDALLLFNFWNSFSAKIQPILEAYQGPIILYHPLGSNHQLPPKHLDTAAHTQYIHSIENWAALERGLRSVHSHTRMSQSRLLRVSGKITEEADDTEPFFGTAIHSVPAAHFNDLFDETALTPEMEKMASAVRRRAMKVIDLSDQAFADAVRAHTAVLNLMERHEAEAITIECLFLKHRKPCLSFSLCNGDLIPCGCENDLNASLTLMLGANLFGRGGFQHNPEFDTEENLYFASHCTCTTQLHGPEGKNTPYLLRPFFHQTPKTLALDVQWPTGEPATLFKYHSEKKALDAWGGVVQGSPTCPPVGGCATRVLVKMNDVDDIRTVYPGPHPVLYCGDFARHAKVYAELYGLEIRSNG